MVDVCGTQEAELHLVLYTDGQCLAHVHSRVTSILRGNGGRVSLHSHDRKTMAGILATKYLLMYYANSSVNKYHCEIMLSNINSVKKIKLKKKLFPTDRP